MYFDRDPEAIGVETDEEVSFRMDLNQSVHDYEPDDNGVCQGFLIRGYSQIPCKSTQKWSVFHDNSDDPRNDFVEGGSHWHGGGDCMCFEDY